MPLELDRITKRFGAREVVSSVSLTAEDGEFVVLLGPSGCGKSTLLRMIAGLETPDEGAIRLAGADITRTRSARPRYRDGVSELRSVSAHDRRAEHRLSAARAEATAGGDRAEVKSRRRTAGPGKLAGESIRASFPEASVSASRWRARSFAGRKRS